MTEQALAVFCRAPVIGQCKTRLIDLLGEAGACQAHIDLAEATLTRTVDVRATRTLWTTAHHPLTTAWAGQFNCALALQQGADLGVRMSDALATSLAQGAERACLIGVDCPPIDTDYVHKAFAALAGADVVIGPAEDGGYGLIGLRRPQPALFQGIAWGTQSVLTQTLARAAQLKLQVAQLPAIWDVDDATDWQRYQAFVRSSNASAIE